jgi:hypothetical protein
MTSHSPCSLGGLAPCMDVGFCRSSARVHADCRSISSRALRSAGTKSWRQPEHLPPRQGFAYRFCYAGPSWVWFFRGGISPLTSQHERCQLNGSSWCYFSVLSAPSVDPRLLSTFGLADPNSGVIVAACSGRSPYTVTSVCSARSFELVIFTTAAH